MGHRAVYCILDEFNTLSVTTVQWSLYIDHNLAAAFEDYGSDAVVARLVEALAPYDHVSCLKFDHENILEAHMGSAYESKETHTNVGITRAHEIMMTHRHNQDGISLIVDLKSRTITFHSARNTKGYVLGSTMLFDDLPVMIRQYHGENVED